MGEKNAADGVEDLLNPNDVDNEYTWTSDMDGDLSNPDGTAFTDFLPLMNGVITTGLVSPISGEQLGGYRDWRIPTQRDLETIQECSFAPICIDPIFGPTNVLGKGLYMTSTSLGDINSANFVLVSFSAPSGFASAKTNKNRVRAVRNIW